MQESTSRSEAVSPESRAAIRRSIFGVFFSTKPFSRIRAIISFKKKALPSVIS